LTDKLSEREIVRAVADATAKRIARRVISALVQMRHTLSGDGSGLKTTWAEICVQVQYQESFKWHVYDYTVRSLAEGYVLELSKHEREAIWLQTDPGGDWDCEKPEQRDSYPVFDEDIIHYVTHEYVYAEAGRWSNTRIRAFIDRSTMRD
jgi:hypothetical protein